MIEIALKNCKLCHEYNGKALSTENETLVLGFYKMRDEAIARVFQALSDYFENCSETLLEYLKEKKRDQEVADSFSLLGFAMDLRDVCHQCDYSSPKLVAKWDERK
jgi:hypothetical protein